MADGQEPFFLDQELQDKLYFTDFRSDIGHCNFDIAEELNLWPTLQVTQQLQPNAYTIQPNLDGSYVNFDGEQLETPSEVTGAPSSDSWASLQPYRLSSEGGYALQPVNGTGKLSSPTLANIEPCSTKQNLPQSCATRSSGPQPKRGRPPKNHRNRSRASRENESTILKSKYAHSVSERRYRDNLNGKMMQLHRNLLAAGTNSNSLRSQFKPSLTGSEHVGKMRKSDILTRAIDYIHQSEVDIRHMHDETRRLQVQVRTLEKLVE
ncbi:Helix-loop-helix DNA-binding domain-containing protein [Cladophialophora immunda]|nr:Helix-loop-helix DNA-binding domain-containing protein [Cladophialophora immunda]